MASDPLFIALAFGLVLLNAFFVAAEFAMVKVRGTRLEELAEGGHLRGRLALAAHKRLDARRATVASSLRGNDWSLTMKVRGSNYEYATRAALNLVNELFLLLHERYPDYLIERFGLSAE